MRQDIREASREGGALHFDGVDEGQRVGKLAEPAAHERKIEPRARKSCREIRQQRPADPAHLLVV